MKYPYNEYLQTIMKDSPLYWIFPWNRFSSAASNYMYHSFVIHNATQQKILQSINTESMSDFKSFSKIITLSQGICTFQWKDRMTNYNIIMFPFVGHTLVARVGECHEFN